MSSQIWVAISSHAYPYKHAFLLLVCSSFLNKFIHLLTNLLKQLKMSQTNRTSSLKCLSLRRYLGNNSQNFLSKTWANILLRKILRQSLGNLGGNLRWNPKWKTTKVAEKPFENLLVQFPEVFLVIPKFKTLATSYVKLSD